MLEIKPVSLEGKCVLLRPPSLNDFDGLSSALQDGDIWNNPYALFPSPGDIPQYLRDLVEGQKSILPFIIIHKQSNKIVGTTRYLNIDYENHRLEIGHTWIAQSYRRNIVNTESK